MFQVHLLIGLLRNRRDHDQHVHLHRGQLQRCLAGEDQLVAGSRVCPDSDAEKLAVTLKDCIKIFSISEMLPCAMPVFLIPVFHLLRLILG